MGSLVFSVHRPSWLHMTTGAWARGDGESGGSATATTPGGLNAPTGRGGLEAVDNDLPKGANLLVRQKLAHVGALIAAELDNLLVFRVLVQGPVAREVLLEGLRLAGGGARRERKGRRKINA